ncbi:MAG: TetR/AcrR family transcriptional regulator [Hyphomicrobium sp.]
MNDSRERMVQAASVLFLGGSFHKVGIAEICAVAHVNKGTFYHFFPSKISLLLEIIDRYTSAVAEQFANVANSALPPARKVSGVFDIPQERNTAWQAEYGSASGCFIGNIILEMAATDPVVRERAEKAIERLTKTLQPIVDEYLQSLKVEGADVPAIAELLMGMIQGAQVQAKVHNDPAVFSRYAAHAPSMLHAAVALPA